MAGAGAEHAQTYILVLGSAQVLKAVQVAYASILTSRGATRWVLVEAVITNFWNIVLNLAFLHGWLGIPRLGVIGVALATVASLAFGLAFTMGVVHLRFGVRLPWSTPPRVLWSRLRSILGIGLPSSLEPIAYQGMQIAVNGFVIAWGAAALAARVYVFNLILLTTILWGVAFGVANQILVAHHIGAQRFEEANAQLGRSLRIGIVGNLALSGLLALLHRPILSLLTEDASIHTQAEPLFLIGLLVEPARAANIIVGGALRSSGDARYTSIVGLGLMWSFCVPMCYVLGVVFGLGLAGIWLAFALDEGVRGVVNFRRWRAGNWRRTRVSLPPCEHPLG
jgi:Na+-driven multidrug efflux pump